jgi:hypothetical protein
MCSSIYLAALEAAELMATEVGVDAASGAAAERYRDLYERGREYVEAELWNGEYFVQNTTWRGLHTTPEEFNEGFSRTDYTAPEAAALLNAEGPSSQYGTGCLSDGIIGAWMAVCAGLPQILDPAKVRSHLRSVYRYNYRSDLTFHANTGRPAYAFGSEGGLLLCSWPKGDMPTIPFNYANEVWTGIEYQVASHLLYFGETEMASDIVATARARYDGTVRNPFDECECGRFYARAMSSFALITLGSGICYDAVTRTLTVREPGAAGLRAFLAGEGGFGTVVVEDGKPRLEVRHGEIPIDRIEMEKAPGGGG